MHCVAPVQELATQTGITEMLIRLKISEVRVPFFFFLKPSLLEEDLMAQNYFRRQMSG